MSTKPKQFTFEQVAEVKRLFAGGCSHAELSERFNVSKTGIRYLLHKWIGRTAKPDYAVDVNTGCWNWSKSTFSSGYGQKTFNRKPQYAHRLYYERRNGKIPDGLSIDHLCKNKRCVNPDHLEAVSQKENVRRGKTTKLTQFMVGCLRRLYRSGISVSRLAQYFQLSRSWTFTLVTNRKRAT